MKTTQIKGILVCFMAILSISIAMISCQQQEVISSDVEQPLTYGDYDTSESQTIENGDIESRIPDCWCQHRGASRRSSSSSYVYCYGYDGLNKTYILTDEHGNNERTEYSTNYFVSFSGLQSGKKYKYRTYTACERPRYSPWTTFTQAY